MSSLHPLKDWSLQHSRGGSYHYAYRPSVTIVGTASGYVMSVEGVSSSIRVEPVTEFVRTCIAGEFEGWDGDTVFNLCNGQVWQQASFSFMYRYRYRPDVLIYRDGLVFRLKVEGIDRTIAVVRLR